MESLWFASPLPEGKGYTWTLASRLSDALHRAEELYGTRDKSYTPVGVEIGGDAPQIWFPGNRKHIVVQITPDCVTNYSRACYQLAHECVHILSPSENPPTNRLEAGLATHFASKYMLDHIDSSRPWNPVLESYRKARDDVEYLLGIDKDIIRKLRFSGCKLRKLSDISASDILNINPKVPKAIAEKLEQRFER